MLSSEHRRTHDVIESMRQWIEQGAPYPRHWSFVAPVRPALPAVRDPKWPLTPVDRFILARLDREGLTPTPVADRYALIRRLSLDLTGLPPTIEEIVGSVTSLHREADSLVVGFDPAAAETVQAVVEAERQCCSTISWQLEAEHGTRLRITALPLQLETLEAMFSPADGART